MISTLLLSLLSSAISGNETDVIKNNIMQRADLVSTFNYSKRCNETNSPLRVCINIVVQKNIILLCRRVTTAIFRN